MNIEFLYLPITNNVGFLQSHFKTRNGFNENIDLLMWEYIKLYFLFMFLVHIYISFVYI